MEDNSSKEEQDEKRQTYKSTNHNGKSSSLSENQRANMTAKKYGKKIFKRRNKVKELLFRGYDQQEIISNLHSSQSTISRDIAYHYSQLELKSSNMGNLALEDLFNNLFGTNELLKMAWEILDNTKKDNKLKLKIMQFILQCYSKQTGLILAPPIVVCAKLKTDEILKKEKYFKDHNIVLDYEKPVSMEEIRKKIIEPINRRRMEDSKF